MRLPRTECFRKAVDLKVRKGFPSLYRPTLESRKKHKRFQINVFYRTQRTVYEEKPVFFYFSVVPIIKSSLEESLFYSWSFLKHPVLCKKSFMYKPPLSLWIFPNFFAIRRGPRATQNGRKTTRRCGQKMQVTSLPCHFYLASIHLLRVFAVSVRP